MTLAVINSCALSGLMATRILTEVHISRGLPSFHIVGLPTAGVRESRNRVRAAILSSGYDFPLGHITVNLSPADLPKESGRYDLPIAIGILLATGQIAAKDKAKQAALDALLPHLYLVGELSLTGALTPVRAALNLAIAIRQEDEEATVILPEANAPMARLVDGLTVIGADSLDSVVAHLSSARERIPLLPSADTRAIATIADAPTESTEALCLSDVRGQVMACRALEVAASGGHGLLLQGPPGVGKSMLAQRLPGILPAPSPQEQLDILALHSLLEHAHRHVAASSTIARPFRSPHHSVTMRAMVGGGLRPMPGEVSLAHHGVLFLDELPEFDRAVLEALREPLETGEILISRANYQQLFPARFQLIAAMNPCPCGYSLTDELMLSSDANGVVAANEVLSTKALGGVGSGAQSVGFGVCRCTPSELRRYQNKLSGPLLDRIDLHLTMHASSVAPDDAQRAETSTIVRQRVTQAHELQLQRQGCLNAHLSAQQLREHCQLSREAQHLRDEAITRFALSGRASHRLLTVARTLADMRAASRIEADDILEALSMRWRGGSVRG